MTEQIVGHYRAPFSNATPTRLEFAEGLTLAEMAALACLPHDFREYGTICVAAQPIDRGIWHLARPKPGHVVTFHYFPIRGGDEGGGTKAILGIVLAVATVLTAGVVGAFGIPGLVAGGSLGAKVLAAGISVVGSLAASALSAPPAKQNDQSGNPQARGAASVSGNILQAGAAIPRVIGTRWIYPPLACQPLIDRDGLDEYAEGVFILAGPHHLEQIRIGDAPIEDSEDVEYQTREGWADDVAIDLVSRYGATKELRLEMSAHQVDGADYFSLVNQSSPELSSPKWHTMVSSDGADEVWLHFSMPGGLSYTESPDDPQFLPIRIRIRQDPGDPWINLPELLYGSKLTTELKPTVRLVWGTAPSIPAVPSKEGWTVAYKYVPGQASPATAAWDASLFSTGSGDDGLYNGVESTTNVKNVTLSQHEAVIYLDENDIPKGSYQIEIKRGQAFGPELSFDRAAYELSGTVYDFFSYRFNTTYRIVNSKEFMSDRLFLLRLSSVFNTHPINNGEEGSGLCTVAIKTLNRQVENLSVLASGYVQDWSGTAWDDWVYGGGYLAAHYRDILRGSLTPDPIDEDVIDEDSLLDWRTDCIANSYTCNLICEGAGIDEVLTKLAGCGYARPAYSEVWGVVRDYDRSAEDPVQIFSSRNSSGLSMAKAFARVPDAFRVTYRSADDLDAGQEIFVYRPGYEDVTNPRVEAVEYEGLTTEAAARARAEYDLTQVVARSAFWSFKAPVEAIMCKRGDLIGINHDVINRTHASARIIDVYVEAGNVTGVELDSTVPLYNEPDMHDVVDMHEVDDMHLVGLVSQISIRQSDGTESQHSVDGATGSRSTVMFVTPVAIEADPEDGEPVIRYDNLVKIGKPGNIAMRLVVASVSYDKDYFGQLTAVAEAPELWAA